MKLLFGFVIALFSGSLTFACQSTSNVETEDNGTKIRVTVDNELFTEFDYKSHAKPILYPVYGPGQIAMTRDWPMKQDSVGESHDHPHHKSMWISHEVSGVDFWAEKGGLVRTQKVESGVWGDDSNAIRATSLWINKKSKETMLTDQTSYWFGGDHESRWINCLVSFRATHGDFQFDDTKEGLFAIRTHPDLRLTADPKRGVAEVFGKAQNSEGETGKAVWGTAAKWMLYCGQIDGKEVSIALYDHPSNLRHPTTWHARDYGLIAANPFGLHHFLGKEKGAGAFTVKQGDRLGLRYRIEFFRGIVSAKTVEESFEAFAKMPLSELNSSTQ